MSGKITILYDAKGGYTERVEADKDSTKLYDSKAASQVEPNRLATQPPSTIPKERSAVAAPHQATRQSFTMRRELTWGEPKPRAARRSSMMRLVGWWGARGSEAGVCGGTRSKP